MQKFAFSTVSGLSRHCRAFCLLMTLLVLGSSVQGQVPPYDNPPDVQAPYYRVRYEGSSEAGKLIFPVTYTVWIPQQARRLRGVIVHQHGCGEGSCKSGQSGAFDLHWQALAKKHDCALLAPSYEQPEGADCQMWCDPRNGSATTFQQALRDLGSAAEHPELSSVPWALWGHSGGGHWAGGMLMLYPQRVAAAWLRSGVPLFEKVDGRNIQPHKLSAAALQVPVMCNLGTKEGVTDKSGRFAGVWPSNEKFFQRVRSAGGLIGIAIDPLTSHECGNQRYLAIPWFDACLTQRLKSDADDSLREIRFEEGWLTSLVTNGADAKMPVPAIQFSGDLVDAIWLPDGATATKWLEYVTDTEVVDQTPPPAPTDVRIVDGYLVWSAEADLESGTAEFRIERNGAEIAKVPQKSKNAFGRPLFQGLQYSDTPAVPLIEMRYKLEGNEPPEHADYSVRAVNTVGLKSPDKSQK